MLCKVQLIYNVSSIQQKDSVIYVSLSIYTYVLYAYVYTYTFSDSFLLLINRL